MEQFTADFSIFEGVNKGYRKSKYQIELERFIESGEPIKRIGGYTTKKAYSCTDAFDKAIERYKMYNVIAITRGEEPYLIRRDMAPEWVLELVDRKRK